MRYCQTKYLLHEPETKVVIVCLQSRMRSFLSTLEVVWATGSNVELSKMAYFCSFRSAIFQNNVHGITDLTPSTKHQFQTNR